MADEGAREAPSGPSLECDLVMKGGITSGVVYPAAVLRLKDTYRFRAVGGASVGAIAAAVVAAAELGRQTGRGTGFDELEGMNREMLGEGFILSLFRPRRGARALNDVAVAALAPGGLGRVIVALLRHASWALGGLALWWGSLAWIGWFLRDRWWLIPALLGIWAVVAWAVLGAITRRYGLRTVAIGAGLAVLWPAVAAPGAVAARGVADLAANGFGIASGREEGGKSGLGEWLHPHIQRAAGLPEDVPLTFGHLEEAGVRLRMMTTNLSAARPVRVPEELSDFAFRSEDLRAVLPDVVVEWLEARSREEPGGLRRLPPPAEVPVLLGFRMSLSFPGLLTAVRLWSEQPQGEPRAHWFSDGGIASNFPIHFFDAWVPSRPTFGLSLGRGFGDAPVKPPPGPNEQRLPGWVRVESLGGFVKRIVDAMQEWRDTMQAELPGFRDRVWEVGLAEDEGGLNLGMGPEQVRRLIEKGDAAGRSILNAFDWDQHWFTRYVMTMRGLELGLAGGRDAGGRLRSGMRPAFGTREEGFAAGDVGAGELFGRDADWLGAAGRATVELLDQAEGWTAFEGFTADEPRPPGTMRIVPDV